MKTLVFGAGISGAAASALLLKNGKEVILYDGNQALDKEAAAEKVRAYGADTEKLNVITGELPIVNDVELAVLSPGIPTDIPEVKLLRRTGIPIIGEVELAYRMGKGKIYAITGTNGKTTTTTLAGELMKAVHEQVDVVGNIGNPYTDAAYHQTDSSVTVAEISSFQLETAVDFHPQAAVITNITEDHMNRHYTMENYIACKEKIAANQTEEDCLILNYEDEVLRAFAADAKAQVVFFSSERELEKGLFLKDGAIVVRRCEALFPGCRQEGKNCEIQRSSVILTENAPGAGEGGKVCETVNKSAAAPDSTENKTIEIIRTEDLRIVGKHNYENVMAAVAIALFDGMAIETIRRVLKDFAGVEHRIEFVGEFSGVKYYNDSKGTNPAAAIKGIQAMSGPTYLIAGGYDKHSIYDEWIESFDGKVKKLVLIGQTKEIIADAAKRLAFPAEDIVFCEDLKEAVDYCIRESVSGDTVLLSPACASWGQFDNYEQRGDMFKEYVKTTAC